MLASVSSAAFCPDEYTLARAYNTQTVHTVVHPFSRLFG